MGSIYRETYTKPMPAGAELFTRDGQRHARWTDRRGRKRTAKVTTGRDGSLRVVLQCTKLTAKLRDGSGRPVKVATGCRSKDAADSILNDLQVRADKVRSGAWSAAEDSTLDHQATALDAHVDAYLRDLRERHGKGAKRRVSVKHVVNVTHCLKRIVAGCGFTRLRHLNRPAVERWADRCELDGMAARTINAHLAALTAFGNWCVEQGRIVANPFARPPKRDERADRRRTRRALTEDELRKLLKVARWRPLAEYGRKVEKIAGSAKRANKRSRRTWKRLPLEFADLDAAVTRARHVLRKRPEYVAKLERRGRERALVYKTLVLTGLRKGELAALTVGHLELDGTVPYVVLDAADEKAGRGAEIPLRGDLATDWRDWLSEVLAEAQDRARAAETAIPARLAKATKLFHVPADLIRAFDRDLLAAGLARMVTDANGEPRIDKTDDRGRTLDVHALRHTFGSHLSRGGVAPRTAQAAMRHSAIELTMQTYTDPRLLDVAGALNVLPDLPLDDASDSRRARATGTDGRKLVPGLVPASGTECAPVATNADPSTARAALDADVSSYSGKICDDAARGGKQRANGFEPSTFSLEG